MRHTVLVKQSQIARTGEPTIQVEFYTAGEFIELRSYHASERDLIGRRIINWVTTGDLLDKSVGYMGSRL